MGMIKPDVRATVLFCALSLSGVAHADNTACWGDDSRKDISCARITEKLLLSLRGQTEAAIRKAMNAPGRSIENVLHFLSNYSRGEKSGSGDVNVTFEDGRATSIWAATDIPAKGHQFLIWSAYAPPPLGTEINRTTKNFARQPFCSDLSGKPSKCSIKLGMGAELTKMQMQGNLPKSDLLKVLEAACNPGQGLAVSDPSGDCAYFRDRLR